MNPSPYASHIGLNAFGARPQGLPREPWQLHGQPSIGTDLRKQNTTINNTAYSPPLQYRNVQGVLDETKLQTSVASWSGSPQGQLQQEVKSQPDPRFQSNPREQATPQYSVASNEYAPPLFVVRNGGGSPSCPRTVQPTSTTFTQQTSQVQPKSPPVSSPQPPQQHSQIPPKTASDTNNNGNNNTASTEPTPATINQRSASVESVDTSKKPIRRDSSSYPQAIASTSLAPPAPPPAPPKEEKPVSLSERIRDLNAHFMLLKGRIKPSLVKKLKRQYRTQANRLEEFRTQVLSATVTSKVKSVMVHFDQQHKNLITLIENKIQEVEDELQAAQESKEDPDDSDTEEAITRVIVRTGATSYGAPYIPKRRCVLPLNEHAVRLLTTWYDKNKNNPHADEDELEQIAKEGNITLTQAKNWVLQRKGKEPRN